MQRFSSRRMNIGENKNYFVTIFLLFVCFWKNIYIWVLGKKSILSRIPSFILPRGKTVFYFYFVFSPLFSSELCTCLNFMICKVLISVLFLCKLNKQEGWSKGNYVSGSMLSWLDYILLVWRISVIICLVGF